ncbi:NAD(P)/FAD-dependent oxidoreductase [Marinobacter sp. CHS3-4]|uniref:NAD(P)/FAD-dependent oxidoreductase n=1 Tax=Marinobacter sp. CHS3-4 TaxID=3045174 RepID=UPI0024B59B0C|nr:NAD(P)/FAD-dependent oxidoreductase [Marinobacter sp. CHS3-4]MDI9244884.1 NAD(P)/FAD-dependent oxidoreductase [Marinobacter sp. CHS3-4]
MTDLDIFQTHSVVVGAGVVGLAVARALARQGREVIVLESGPRFGEGVSSRNSEVVHAGIYYPEDSLKAELCVKGRQDLYEFCGSRHLPIHKCGKWIVAQGPEVERLAAIKAQASRNGVDLHWWEGPSFKSRLPEVNAHAALFSPETGIVDSHAMMLALLGELEDAGGQLICQAPVEQVVSEPAGYRIRVGGQAPCWLQASQLVNSAGLGAIALAQRLEGLPDQCIPRPFYARGVYFSYPGKHPFRSLVYPVPEPGGLGIHLTLDMAGQVRFGPDVEWVETPDFTVDGQRASQFAASVRRWWPRLDERRLQPAYAGVRPKLHGPEDSFADFQIQGQADHGLPGLVNLFGIESPGLTASLAIADRVADLLGQ